MRGLDLTGQVFGRLSVKNVIHDDGKKKWLCQCECGNEVIVLTGHLRSSNGTKSCGCMRKECASRVGREYSYTRVIHGINNTPIKRCYDNMKKRCYNPLDKRYDRYGARGIKICDEWLVSRSKFYKWALENGWEEGLTIERMDVDGDYCPENCTWIPMEKQQSNTSRNVFFEYKGESLHLAEICRREDIVYSIVRKRIARGWSLEDSLNKNLGRIGGWEALKNREYKDA